MVSTYHSSPYSSVYEHNYILIEAGAKTHASSLSTRGSTITCCRALSFSVNYKSLNSTVRTYPQRVVVGHSGLAKSFVSKVEALAMHHCSGSVVDYHQPSTIINCHLPPSIDLAPAVVL